MDGPHPFNGVPCLQADAWAELESGWDDEPARFRVGDDAWHELPRAFPTCNGISYLHLQSAATEADPLGALIESVSAAAARTTATGTVHRP